MSKTYPLTKRTLVLDLDECLWHTFKKNVPNYQSKVFSITNSNHRAPYHKFTIYDIGKPRGSGISEQYEGILRPHLYEFLNFAFRYFEHVIVWSAAHKSYVEELVKKLFRDHPQPLAVFTRDDVTYEDNVKNDYHKPISTLVKKLGLHYSDIVFVDDKADNFRDNPKNGIVIPRFEPKFELSKNHDDVALLQIMQWLMLPHVLNAKDFRELDKSRIFNVPVNFQHPEMIEPNTGFGLVPIGI